MTLIYKPRRGDLACTKDVIRAVAGNTGMTVVEARAFVHATVDVIRGLLGNGVRVYIDGLGTFGYRYRKGRSYVYTFMRGKNKGKQRPVTQPDKWVVKFYPATTLMKVANHRAPPQLPIWSSGDTLPAGDAKRKLPKNAFTPANRPIPPKKIRPPSTTVQTAPGTECNSHSQDPAPGMEQAQASPAVEPGDNVSSPDQTPDSGSSGASGEASVGGSDAPVVIPAPPPGPSQPAVEPKSGPRVARLAGRPTIP